MYDMPSGRTLSPFCTFLLLVNKFSKKIKNKNLDICTFLLSVEILEKNH